MLDLKRLRRKPYGDNFFLAKKEWCSICRVYPILFYSIFCGFFPWIIAIFTKYRRLWNFIVFDLGIPRLYGNQLTEIFKHNRAKTNWAELNQRQFYYVKKQSVSQIYFDSERFYHSNVYAKCYQDNLPPHLFVECFIWINLVPNRLDENAYCFDPILSNVDWLKCIKFNR